MGKLSLLLALLADYNHHYPASVLEEVGQQCHLVDGLIAFPFLEAGFEQEAECRLGAEWESLEQQL